MAMEMGLVGNFNRYLKEDPPSGQASSGHSYLFKGLIKCTLLLGKARQLRSFFFTFYFQVTLV